MTQQTHHSDFDIAICGAGPVGTALAALLLARGIDAKRIALLDGKALDVASKDPRSLALSWGSRQILEQVGAWPLNCTAIHEIHVSRRGYFGRTFIDRQDYELPALGYVARYGELVSRLDACARGAGLTAMRPVRIIASNETADSVRMNLDNGQTLTTNILAQAEGGMFNEQAAKSQQRDYQQTAVVAHVTSSHPLSHRAFERFTDEGPLALLPQDDGYSMVWCMHPDSARRLQTLTEQQFIDELQQAFGTRVGRFTSVGSRHSFPLGLNARPAATTRTIAIGNAAQTLHPVAGQGLNLGLRDATVLARLLADDASPDTLVKFAQAREADRSTTIRVTDTLARLFADTSKNEPGQTVLAATLGLLDLVSPARHLIAEHMMFGRR